MSNDYTTELNALDVTAQSTEDLVDDNEVIEINNKDIQNVPDALYVVCCDANSQLVTFRINRFIEGIDLYDKVASIKFKNALGQCDRATPHTLKADGTYVIFTWLLDRRVTQGEGTVTFQIEFLDAEGYSWQTKTQTFKVLPTLDVDSGIEPPTPTWVQEITAEVATLKKIIEGTNFATYEIGFEDELDTYCGRKTASGHPYSTEPVLYKIIAKKRADYENNIVDRFSAYFLLAFYSTNGTTVGQYVSQYKFMETGIWYRDLHFHMSGSPLGWSAWEQYGVDAVARDIAASKAGKVYYDGKTAGGEIFGDYETNAALGEFTAAFGSGSTAGQKGYYMKAINFGDSAVIALSSSKVKVMPDVDVDMDDYLASKFVSGFAVGDAISIMNNEHYQYCATITAINGNIITVGRLPFDSIDETGAADIDDNIVFVPAKPRVGAVSFTSGGLAVGLDTVAGGKGAFACGRETVAAGGGSFAAGRKTKAGYIATATGFSTFAAGIFSFVANSYTLATGQDASAFGMGTAARGRASFSTGSSTTAAGDNSASFGAGTQAIGKNSFASGENSIASNTDAFAANNGTVASGMASATFGMGTAAKGIASFALGSVTRAIGRNSFTWGEGTVAEGDNMQAGGKYNLTTKDKILVYGKGQNAESREDAYTLDGQGNGWYAGNVEASALILRSSTPDSTKKFKITVDDNGAITATEL